MGINWLRMLRTAAEDDAQEGDYCSGLSLNCDFWWNKGRDVSFLTTGGRASIIGLMEQAVQAGRMKVFDKRLTRYGKDPGFGFSYLVVLGQSHVMIHTWPEKGLMNVDVFTCGSEGNPQAILDYLKGALHPDSVSVNQAKRGIRRDIESASESPDSPGDLKPAASPPVPSESA